jgi:hypothetical protein
MLRVFAEARGLPFLDLIQEGNIGVLILRETGSVALLSREGEIATDKQKEAAWRVEFEALGEQLVFVKRGRFTTTKRSVRRCYVGFPNGTVPPS